MAENLFEKQILDLENQKIQSERKIKYLVAKIADLDFMNLDLEKRFQDLNLDIQEVNRLYRRRFPNS